MANQNKKNFKPVMSQNGIKYELIPMPTGCGCAACGGTGEWAAICSDCGAIFCESCVTDGTFDDHECDEEEYE